MVLRRLLLLLFAATLLCGCEGPKASTEPVAPVVKKDANKSQSKGNTATVSEPP